MYIYIYICLPVISVSVPIHIRYHKHCTEIKSCAIAHKLDSSWIFIANSLTFSFNLDVLKCK